MAKQKYEKKVVTQIIGYLTKDSEGQYIVTVSDKDSSEEYSLNDILDDCLEQVITFTSEN